MTGLLHSYAVMPFRLSGARDDGVGNPASRVFSGKASVIALCPGNVCPIKTLLQPRHRELRAQPSACSSRRARPIAGGVIASARLFEGQHGMSAKQSSQVFYPPHRTPVVLIAKRNSYIRRTHVI